MNTVISVASIQTLTKVEYPTLNIAYKKFDTFNVPSDINSQEILSRDNEEIYDWLNKNGYWVLGHQEISDEQDELIDAHPELHGSQTETVVKVEWYL